MYKAFVMYKSGKSMWFQANTIEMIKSKAEPYIDNNNVASIKIEETKGLGYLKHPLLEEYPEMRLERKEELLEEVYMLLRRSSCNTSIKYETFREFKKRVPSWYGEEQIESWIKEIKDVNWIK